MPGLYSHISRAVGLTLTANIYNSDHVNHITNQITTMMDDYSANAAQMQTTADPYPAGAESLATSLAGELERIRYVIKQITGKDQWYIDPDTVAGIINYRSEFNCIQASTTTITVEGGVIDVDGTTIIKTSNTTLDLTVAGDWVDDTSDRAVSTYGYIYINAAGKIEMDSVAPDESDTSGNTTGTLRYNDTGTDTSDRRIIGGFYMNATGSGELTSENVWTTDSHGAGIFPSFSAHKGGSDQTGIVTATWTKVTWSTEIFDTNKAFDSVTNSRFTPGVAGKYMLTSAMKITVPVSGTVVRCGIYKNGALLYGGFPNSGQNASIDEGCSVTAIVNANATDYFEVFIWQNSGSDKVIDGTATEAWFSGARIS